ncbi:biofilm operon icaADBC HTH-type negative transcriptional regulator IcaR [bacterium BMS3Bbin10]|nr:biofilm operon icaADBC HTH-type negative transcriptional regulator IcaR [bacterium BMS3Bbin10]
MAAKKVFLERGFDGTSMDEVAAHAGTTKRTLYNHFSNKEELFRTVVEKSIELFFSKLPDLDAEGKPADELERFAARFCELCTWTVAVQLQQVVISEQKRFPELAVLLAEEIVGRSVTKIAAYFEDLNNRRILECGDPQQAARLFLNLATGIQRFDALFGTVAPLSGPPGKSISRAIDRKLIRAAVSLFLEATPASQ